MGFLIKYFIEYLKERIKGLDHWETHREISFEKEAKEAEKYENTKYKHGNDKRRL